MQNASDWATSNSSSGTRWVLSPVVRFHFEALLWKPAPSALLNAEPHAQSPFSEMDVIAALSNSVIGNSSAFWLCAFAQIRVDNPKNNRCLSVFFFIMIFVSVCSILGYKGTIFFWKWQGLFVDIIIVCL